MPNSLINDPRDSARSKLTLKRTLWATNYLQLTYLFFFHVSHLFYLFAGFIFYRNIFFSLGFEPAKGVEPSQKKWPQTSHIGNTSPWALLITRYTHMILESGRHPPEEDEEDARTWMIKSAGCNLSPLHSSFGYDAHHRCKYYIFGEVGTILDGIISVWSGVLAGKIAIFVRKVE